MNAGLTADRGPLPLPPSPGACRALHWPPGLAKGRNRLPRSSPTATSQHLRCRGQEACGLAEDFGLQIVWQGSPRAGLVTPDTGPCDENVSPSAAPTATSIKRHLAKASASMRLGSEAPHDPHHQGYGRRPWRWGVRQAAKEGEAVQAWAGARDCTPRLATALSPPALPRLSAALRRGATPPPSLPPLARLQSAQRRWQAAGRHAPPHVCRPIGPRLPRRPAPEPARKARQGLHPPAAQRQGRRDASRTGGRCKDSGQGFVGKPKEGEGRFCRGACPRHALGALSVGPKSRPPLACMPVAACRARRFHAPRHFPRSARRGAR